MKSGKRVLSILIISLFLISSINIVSAGFKDWFSFGEQGKGEGQLADSSGGFNVSIETSNDPPTIRAWTVPGSGTLGPTCDSQTAIATNFEVSVYDPNGCRDLADDGTVTVYMHKTYDSVTVYRPGGESAPIPVSCTESADPGTCSATDPNIVNFSCNGLISMEYYDLEGDWIINVSATDGSLSADNSGLESDGGLFFPYFGYGNQLCIELNDSDTSDANEDTLVWKNAQAISALATNVEASNHIIIFNKGNINISNTGTDYLRIAADNLTGTLYGDKILPSSFSTDESDTPCDSPGGVAALDYDLQNIPGALLSLDTESTKASTDLYFCFESLVVPVGQSGIQTDGYTTGSLPWEINAIG